MHKHRTREPDGKARETVKFDLLPPLDSIDPGAVPAPLRHAPRILPTARFACGARVSRSLYDRGRGASRRAVHRASARGRCTAGGAPRWGPRKTRRAVAPRRIRAVAGAGPASRGFPCQCLRRRARGARAGGGAPRAGASLRGEAAIRPAQGDERPQGGRRRDIRWGGIASRDRIAARRIVHGACLREGRDAMATGRDEECERAGRGDALCRVGGAHRGGTRGAQGRRAVPRAAQARLPEARPAAIHTGERRRRLDARRRPQAGARRLRADRFRHGTYRGAGRGPLLHLVPRAGEGFVRARLAGKEIRRWRSAPRFRSAGARSASSSPGVRWKRRSPSSRSCARKAGPSPRLRSCAWTTRWLPPPGIGSATTA